MRLRWNEAGHRLRLVFLSLLAVTIVGVVVLSLVRMASTRRTGEKLAETEKLGRKVNTAQVKKAIPERSVLLTGEARPYYSVTLYARVSGYLRELDADIGDHVKEGQVLARVESPETEQAYNSARSDAANRRKIADRMRALLKRKLVSPQEAEGAISAAEIAESTLKTQEVVRGYQTIEAPFDGVITQRLVDPGTLIQNASSSQAASQPLFTISQTDRLRVFAYVSQSDAPFVHPGDGARIEVPGHSEIQLDASVDRIAGELDPRTRTQQTEFVVDNHERRIVPGSFVQVRMKIHTPDFLELPVQALVMRDNAPTVPRVDDKGEVHYQKIDLVENDGTRLVIRSGIREGERVALDIGNSLQEGQKVRWSEGAAQAGQAGK